MTLEEVLDQNSQHGKKRRLKITEELLCKDLETYRKAIAFWRVYPDKFIDFITQGTPFKFFPYQRITLRIFMRYRETYGTAPRGFSKSFLSVLTMMLKCILYPGSKVFVTTGVKQQAASILKEKVENICTLIPALKNEIVWTRGGGTQTGRDFVQYRFKNGSVLDVLNATESTRGQRRVGGIVEEAATVDGDILNEVIIPTMAITRRLPDGSQADWEKINKSQVYITTAGFKTTYAYEKLMEILVKQLTQEKQDAFAFGCTWRIPQKANQYQRGYIQELKLSGTYTDEAFEREFESRWAGSVENSFFNIEKFDKSRSLVNAELAYNKTNIGKSKTAYYLMSVDVGRNDCTTEVCVFRVHPQLSGNSFKSLVNCISIPESSFSEQAVRLKQIFFNYKCKIMVLDCNGIGFGLMDFMVLEQTDPDTGEVLPPFMPENDGLDGKEKIYKDIRPGAVLNAIYMMKAHAKDNTECYTYCKTALGTERLKLLIDEQSAKTRLLATKEGQNMTPEQRTRYLQPYVFTTGLREQMMNLVGNQDGKEVILKRVSQKVSKDRFSAFVYGIWYIQKQDNKARKRKGRFSDFMFHS